MSPKMLSEIMEAITTHFDDQPDVVADCMRYLYNSLTDEADVGDVLEWFGNHDRCARCGEKKEFVARKELHPELGIGMYEMMYESHCPNCDMVGDRK